MADQTRIEWTEATWNPVVGCSLVSPGCTNCYAMRMAHRHERMCEARGGLASPYEGLTKQTKAGPVWTGRVGVNHAALHQPLRWRRPRRIFVNSMSDLFHEDLPVELIAQPFAIMGLARQHRFQVLTKRSQRMRDMIGDDRFADLVDHWMNELAPAHWCARELDDAGGWPLPNVSLGVSVEDQRRANERIPLLLETPAAVRFISAEPLLGPVDLTQVRAQIGANSYETASCLEGDDGFGLNKARNRIDWVIVGGESGPGARPMHPDWARSIRDQCAASGAPFFFKQWGAYEPTLAAEDMAHHLRCEADGWTLRDLEMRCEVVWPDGRTITPLGDPEWWQLQDFGFDGTPDEMKDCAVVMRRVGKKVAGRRLDGRVHDAYPA